MQATSEAGEFACSILAGARGPVQLKDLRAEVCSALFGTPLKKDCTEWLVNSSLTQKLCPTDCHRQVCFERHDGAVGPLPLRDQCANRIAQRPEASAPAVSVSDFLTESLKLCQNGELLRRLIASSHRTILEANRPFLRDIIIISE